MILGSEAHRSSTWFQTFLYFIVGPSFTFGVPHPSIHMLCRTHWSSKCRRETGHFILGHSSLFFHHYLRYFFKKTDVLSLFIRYFLGIWWMLIFPCCWCKRMLYIVPCVSWIVYPKFSYIHAHWFMHAQSYILDFILTYGSIYIVLIIHKFCINFP